MEDEEDVDTMWDEFKTAYNETTEVILGKRRKDVKEWVSENTLENRKKEKRWNGKWTVPNQLELQESGERNIENSIEKRNVSVKGTRNNKSTERSEKQRRQQEGRARDVIQNNEEDQYEIQRRKQCAKRMVMFLLRKKR